MPDQQLDIAAPSDTRHLLVACGDAATRRSVERMLATATPAPAVTGCDGVEAALAQDPALPVIVPVTLPLDHLGAALRAGTAPDEALADWRAEAETLLRTCRKTRRRVLLIDAGMLETQPDACAQALGARLGLRLGTIVPTAPPAAGRSAIHTVIAATLLASDAEALALLDELEAMILGSVSPRGPARAEIGEAMETAAVLHEERDLLRETLAQMLGETERLLGEEGDLKNKLETRNTELAGKHLLKAQLDAATRQLDAAQDTQRWRDAVLGGAILNLASQEREQRSAQQAARDEIARLRDSTSWKVTRPLRAVRRGPHRS